jgi:hypothetical protein
VVPRTKPRAPRSTVQLFLGRVHPLGGVSGGIRGPRPSLTVHVDFFAYLDLARRRPCDLCKSICFRQDTTLPEHSCIRDSGGRGEHPPEGFACVCKVYATECLTCSDASTYGYSMRRRALLRSLTGGLPRHPPAPRGGGSSFSGFYKVVRRFGPRGAVRPAEVRAIEATHVAPGGFVDARRYEVQIAGSGAGSGVESRVMARCSVRRVDAGIRAPTCAAGNAKSTSKIGSRRNSLSGPTSRSKSLQRRPESLRRRPGLRKLASADQPRASSRPSDESRGSRPGLRVARRRG